MATTKGGTEGARELAHEQPMGVPEGSRFDKVLREARAAIHHPPLPRTELVKEGARTYEREVPGAPPGGAAPTTGEKP